VRIDIPTANDQASQTRNQANDLHTTRVMLQNYQKRLHDLWQGVETVPMHEVIDAMLKLLSNTTNEMNVIGNDIISVAEVVRRAEELANARAILSNEDTNVTNLQRAFDIAGNNFRVNPSPASQNALNIARNNLNNAIRARNNAAARVRVLL